MSNYCSNYFYLPPHNSSFGRLLQDGAIRDHNRIFNDRNFCSVTPYSGSSPTYAPLKEFDVRSRCQTLVKEILSKRILFQPDTVSHEESVQKGTSQVVMIYTDLEGPLGTATLISPNQLLTARHILNGIKPSDIKVAFDFTTRSIQPITMKGRLLEDGAKFGLDYAILELSSKVNRVAATLSQDNVSNGSSLLIHHPNGEPQHFSVHQADESPYYNLQYTPFHDTNEISSGAGYRDVENRLFAIHTSVNSSDLYLRRSALFIRTILDTNRSSLLHQLVGNFSSSPNPNLNSSIQNTPLPFFSLSPLDIDEGRRSEAL